METWHNFNGKLQEGNQLQIALDNRAFHYGDGFFESLRFSGEACDLWQYHEERIFKSVEVLRMVVKEGFARHLFNEVLRLLKKLNLQEQSARVRIQVFRSGAGLYTPDQNGTNFLIEAQALPTKVKRGCHLAFCKEPVSGNPSFKGAKTLNALPYVLAGIERAEKKVDEILLHHTNGVLIEASASNVWWVEDEAICTPPLSSGCVDGVFRRHLLMEIPKQGMEVKEKEVNREELLKAKEVFLTNAVHGIQWVEEIDGVFFGSQVSHYLLENI